MRSRLLAVGAVVLLLGAAVLLWVRGHARGDGADDRRAPAVGGTPPALATADVAVTPRLPEEEKPEAGESSPPATEWEPPSADVALSGIVTIRGTSRRARAGHVYLDERASGEGASIRPDGGYSMRVPVGTLVSRVTVRPPGRPGGAIHFLPTISSVGEQRLDRDTTLDLEVDEGLTVAGVVVSASTGTPVPGARVEGVHLGLPMPSETTDGAGRFRLAGFPPPHEQGRGSVVIEASHRDHLTRRIEVVPVPAGSTGPLERVELERGVRLAGRVIAPDPADMPSRWTLTLYVPSSSGWGLERARVASVEADEDGRFELPPIAPATDGVLVATLQANESREAWASLDGLDLTRDRDDLAVSVTRPAVACVHARYPDSVPDHADSALPGDLHLLVQDVAGAWRAIADRAPDGGIEVTLATGRRHAVRAFARRDVPGRPREHFRGETTIVGTERPQEVTIDLRRASAPPEVPREGSWGERGGTSYEKRHYFLRFVDADTGRRLGGRAFSVSDSGGGGAGVLPADGRTRESFALGRWSLRLTVEGYAPVDVVIEPLEPGIEEVELRMTPLAR